MYILPDYTFSPGEAGVGTITVPGTLALENFGIIVNVTRGSILYSPTEGQAGATLSQEEGFTILTLEQRTTYCDPDDDLQIAVYSTGGGGGSDEILSGIGEDTSSIDSKIPELSEGRIPVDIGGASVTIEGDVTVSNEVEVKNDSNNPIPTLPAGIIDAGNGYSGTLTENQVFTGTGIEVSPKYGTISVCIFSSHASASFGLKFQASIDNVNWETIEEYNYLASTGLQSYSFSPSGRYFRIQYTNGATATTKTAIFTALRSGYTKSSSHRIGDVINGEQDAELVKAVLAAMKPNGDFTDIHCTAGGNLKVSVEEVEGTLPTSVPVRVPTTTSVSSSATSVPILASNANRKGFSISNISTSKLYLSFTDPATTANCFIELPAGAFLLLDQQLIVSNAIYGIWASANGAAQVTEYV
jgi:hypothetical protein